MQIQSQNIEGFFGDFRFLSNFWLAPVMYDYREYKSVEHAYQAAKTMDLGYRRLIQNSEKPGNAKKLGSEAALREDWEQIRVQLMYDLVSQKFENNDDLMAKLKMTGNSILIETNTWGDTFWGVCDGKGFNTLGKILMIVRGDTNV